MLSHIGLILPRPCYGDEGPCDCRYCEPGEHRSRQSRQGSDVPCAFLPIALPRHWRSGLRSSDLWEAPLPCGLLPSDVSELLFRDIVPEDSDMSGKTHTCVKLQLLDSEIPRLQTPIPG